MVDTQLAAVEGIGTKDTITDFDTIAYRYLYHLDQLGQTRQAQCAAGQIVTHSKCGKSVVSDSHRVDSERRCGQLNLHRAKVAALHLNGLGHQRPH